MQVRGETVFEIEQGEIRDSYAEATHPWTQENSQSRVFARRSEARKYMCPAKSRRTQIHVDRFRHERKVERARRHQKACFHR